MNTLDRDYQDIIQKIFTKGSKKGDRTGTGTISIFGEEISHNMKEGFPLLTTKKMAWKTMVTELLWFLKGDTNIKYLVENGCNIWNGDAYKAYATYARGLEEPDYSVHIDDPVQNKVRILTQAEFIERINTDDLFAMQWGELGPIYGKQWRDWNGTDQIQNLINDLKTNPDSRRLMVNAWNVDELDKMTLPPCHYGFQVYTRELSQNERWSWYQKQIGSAMYHDRIEQEMDAEGVPTREISLMWNQRSADYFLGVPFNIASYGLLLTIIANIVDMVPGKLVGRFGDTHLYLNHTSQASKQLVREPYKLPTLKINKDKDFWNQDLDLIIDGLLKEDFELVEYQYHPSIKAPLSN